MTVAIIIAKNINVIVIFNLSPLFSSCAQLRDHGPQALHWLEQFVE